MDVIELNQVTTDDFTVIDSSGNEVTGLIDANFTKVLYNPAGSDVWGTQGGSITELGNGRYRITFTPNSEGDWLLIVKHTTYFPSGKSANYQCYQDRADRDAILADTDAIDTRLPSDPADQSAVEAAISASETNIITEIDANETKIDAIYVDTQAIDGRLPTDPADQSDVEAAITTSQTTIITEIDANETKIDIIDTVVDAIKLKTDNLPDDPEWFIAKSGLVIAGSTTTEIRTDFTEADNFFNNMQVVVVNAAGTVARNVDDYAQTNGAITVTALPFTPATNDVVFIISRTGSVPVDTASIADAVWDEDLVDHTGVDTMGEAQNRLDNIQTQTDLLPADPASQSDVEIAIANATTSIKGADGDDLKDISDQIDTLPTPPTVGEIDTQLSTTHGAGNWEGAGAPVSTLYKIVLQSAEHVSGGQVTIKYKAPTGRSDVVIDIYDPDNTQIVTAQPMSEINTIGVYEYDWVPVSAGQFTIRCEATGVSDSEDSMDIVVRPSGGSIETGSA